MTKSKGGRHNNQNGAAVTQINQKAKGKGDQNISNGKAAAKQRAAPVREVLPAMSPSVIVHNMPLPIQVQRKKNGTQVNGIPAEHQLKKMRDAERQEREGIVLWKRPFTTLKYFFIELCLDVQEYAYK